MEEFKVNLLTPEGVIIYPSYREEIGVLDAGGNITDIIFTPFDADAPLTITAISLVSVNTTLSLPVEIPLSVGTVIKFPVGTLTTSSAAPVVLRGAPYMALVRARQCLLDLMNVEPAYALQAMPEPDKDFAFVYLLSSNQEPYFFDTGFLDGWRFYDFAATATIAFIIGSPTAQQFLSEFIAVLQTRRGYYWQVAKGADVVRWDELANTAPLLNNLVYQQQSQVSITLSFVYRHFEKEGWIASAEVSEEMTHVTLTPEGE